MCDLGSVLLCFINPILGSRLFVCLFVGIKLKKHTPPPVGREVNPLGVVTHGRYCVSCFVLLTRNW